MSSFFNPGRTPSRPPSLVTISEASDSSESWVSSPLEPNDHDDGRIYVHHVDGENNNPADTATILNHSHSNSNNNDNEAQSVQQPCSDQPNKNDDSNDSNDSNESNNSTNHHETHQSRTTNINPHQTNTDAISTSQPPHSTHTPQPPRKAPAEPTSSTPVSAQQDETQRRQRADLRDRYYRTDSLLNEYRTWMLDYPIEISILEEILSKLKRDGNGYENKDGKKLEKEDEKSGVTGRRDGISDVEGSNASSQDSGTMCLSTLTSTQRVERAIDRLREDLELATLMVPILEDLRDKMVPMMRSRERSDESSETLSAELEGNDADEVRDEGEDEFAG